ncbi:hypothetical protein KGQ29_00705 [Patescibacteria group bacterium]|nr:hypothetical protein [Patescibacteria group bacterium]
MSEGFLQESWGKNQKIDGAVEDTSEADKSFFIFFTLEDEISKIKNRGTKKYLEGILEGLKNEVMEYSKDIEVVETPFGKKFLTQKTFENKRRINHNAIITSLLTLYRYLRKEKLDISWADNLGYDESIRDDLNKFDNWETTDWALNLAKKLQNQKIEGSEYEIGNPV